jgi:hypothetical protein
MRMISLARFVVMSATAATASFTFERESELLIEERSELLNFASEAELGF